MGQTGNLTDISVAIVGSLAIAAIMITAIITITGMIKGSFKKVADADFARLDRKLNRILEHLGLDIVEPFETDIWNISQTQGKIAAIKAYREQTDACLAKAKADVETIMRSYSSMTTGKPLQPDREV